MPTSTRLVVAAAIFCGLVLRLGFLGSDSFWLDETFSVAAVRDRSSVGEIWNGAVDQNHPPLYFVILWAALRVGGVSESVARAPSALASVLDLALVFVLAKRLGASSRAAFWAAGLLAVAPLSIWYAQEARMYALVATCGLLFAIGLTFRSWIGAVASAAALTAGLYMDFTMVPLSALVTGLWIVRWSHTGGSTVDLARVAMVHAAAWIAFRPEWAHLGEVLDRIDTVPLFVNLRRWFGLHITPGVPAVLLMMTIAITAAAVAAAIWRLSRLERFSVWWSWLVWATFVASSAAFTVPRAYSAKQFLATGWPLIVLAVAWTLVDAAPHAKTSPLRHRRIAVAAVVSLIAAIVTVNTPRADWRGVVAYLNARAPRTQAVWLDPSWNSIPYDYYRPRIAPTVDPLQAGQEPVRFAPGHEVCLVAQRYGAAPPTSPSERWLDNRSRLVESASFARLEVRCYAE